MDKKLAEEIMSVIDDANTPFDKLDALSMSIKDESERVEFRKILAKALVAIGYDMVAHICRQYPDLDPDKPE